MEYCRDLFESSHKSSTTISEEQPKNSGGHSWTVQIEAAADAEDYDKEDVEDPPPKAPINMYKHQ
jgi:6-pyruvoyl-tetrahydropterin synthase